MIIPFGQSLSQLWSRLLKLVRLKSYSGRLERAQKMKGKRYTTETKIRILREAQSRDKTIQDVCRERQISEQTYHRWKRELGMLEINQAKQLKELQRENARLKRMLADEMLGKELLKEVLEKKL